MKYFILLFTSTLILSCASSQNEIKLPFWVNNPDIPNFYGVSTKAKVQKFGGRDAQFRVAMTMARVDIAKAARVHIYSAEKSKTSTSDKGTSFLSDTSTQISTAESLRLDKVFVKEQWHHPETDELYIWVLMPK